jgi:hypothetical protein
VYCFQNCGTLSTSVYIRPRGWWRLALLLSRRPAVGGRVSVDTGVSFRKRGHEDFMVVIQVALHNLLGNKGLGKPTMTNMAPHSKPCGGFCKGLGWPPRNLSTQPFLRAGSVARAA